MGKILLLMGSWFVVCLLLCIVGFPYGIAAVLAFVGPILLLVAAVKSTQNIQPVREQPRDEHDQMREKRLEPHVCTLQEISISLEEIAGVKEALGVENLLPSFFMYMFYELVLYASCSRDEKYSALTMLLERCPANLEITGQEIFNHIEANDSMGQLILAMKDYPVVILDLANKTGREEDGKRFLQAFAALFIAAGVICNQTYPGSNFQDAARKACSHWLDYVSEKIEG